MRLDRIEPPPRPAQVRGNADWWVFLNFGKLARGLRLYRVSLTYLGAQFDGVGFEGRICGVSILRAGEVWRILALNSELLK